MGSAADADTSVNLLFELQSAFEFSGKTYEGFNQYLYEFSSIAEARNSSKSTENFSAIRALTKRFLPFLNKALSLLPKRLSETSKISEESALNLLKIYRLCLCRLDLVSSQLDAKPYSVQIQKLRFIRCLEAWKMYEEAEREAFLVLDNLRGDCHFKGTGSKSSVSERRALLPPLNGANVDQEYAWMVLDVAITFVRCALMKQSKDTTDYNRILNLVNEASPWFKVLEVNAHDKMLRMLLKYLSGIALLLAKDSVRFGWHLVRRFCEQIFDLYRGSSERDEVWKFARNICSSLFAQQQASDTVDLLKFILESMSNESKDGSESTMLKYLELIGYSANKCRIITSISSDVAMHFEELSLNLKRKLNKSVDSNQGGSTAGWIIGIYATSLSILRFASHSTIQGNTKEGSALRILLGQREIIQKLKSLLNLSKHGLNIGIKQSNSPHKHVLFLPSYFDALKFLCHPLAQLINSEREEEFTEMESLYVFQDVLSQYCQLLIQCHSGPSSKREECDEKSRNIHVAVAAFSLSLRTKHNIEENVKFLEYFIQRDIHIHGLKYLFTSLYNVAVAFYKSKQMIEASKALKLCSKASSACILRSCEKLPHISNELQNELSEDFVIGFINNAFAKIANLLDALYHSCSSNEVETILIDCLKSWSVAKCLHGTLPGPTVIVKQSVKIKLELHKDVDIEEDATLLYPILSSSEEFRGTVGLILEEELQAYKDLISMNRSLCQKMRLKIISILLEKVYATEDTYLQKSRVLIAKSEELRGQGICRDCIWCLSEAISTMEKHFAGKERDGEKNSCTDSACDIVARAYCIRALCTNEIEPNSKLLYEDIYAAVRVLMSPHVCHPSGQCNMLSEAMLNLLYQIIDLLSIKGNLESHTEIFEVIIQLSKLKKIPLEILLSWLWKHRRLSHALCALPVNDIFIEALSKHCGEVVNSLEYWTNCLKASQPLLVGFHQSFHAIFSLSSQNPCNYNGFLQSDISDNKVKLTALDLASNVPLSSDSAFLSAYIYYDLSERLIQSGQLTEAFSYAKKAYHLRHALLNKKFLYHMEQQNGNYCLASFQIYDPVATEALFCENISFDSEGCMLTPWNVLQCYLESTLQVGIINEILGNGDVAKHYLQLGKVISCSQSLPLFIVSFSCIIGQIYIKQELWEMAEKETQAAKEALADSFGASSCKCRAVFEVTIDKLFGDIYRKRFCSDLEKSISKELILAKEKYKSAIDKLALSKRNNFFGGPKVVDSKHAKHKANSLSYHATAHSILEEVPSKCRKHENAAETVIIRKNEDLESGIRLTRSRYRSLNKSCETVHAQSDTAMELNSTCYRLTCWHYLTLEALHSGCMSSFICFKWELIRRNLLQQMLISLGKCSCLCNENHEAHKVFLQSVYLVTRDPSCPQYSSLSFVSLLDQVEKNNWSKLFAVYHAEMLYYICWSALKNNYCKATRKLCCKSNCDFSSVKISKIVYWLKVAFIQSREVPLHFQKVSRLLATIYVLSTSIKSLAVPSHNVVSERQWASFFHQASLGAHFNLQLFSTLKKQQNGQDISDFKGSCSSNEADKRKHSTLWNAPGSVDNLEDFVLQYFESLPSATVVCISFIAGTLATLLGQLLSRPFPIQAWILLSRMSSTNNPVIVVLPINSVLKDTEELCSSVSVQASDFTKQWHCSWASSCVINNVAPLFRDILEKNYLCLEVGPLEDTSESRALWWKSRRQLDESLARFLQDLEELWLGPWKYLLLGELSGCELLDSSLMSVVEHLKLENKSDVDMALLKIVLGGANHAVEKDDCIFQLLLTNGCHIGGHGDGTCQPLSKSCTYSEAVYKTIFDAADKLEGSGCINRKPSILILDFDLQMLPWENLPILKDQEVYRMPSIGAINATLVKRCLHQEAIKNGNLLNSIPLVDPLDSYYVLNPDGDLSFTQAALEGWFNDKNFEGTSGVAPTVDELTGALKRHDLFLYFGHGSGMQYIPAYKIEDLEICSASLLMGCSSGSLKGNKTYIPQGAPLCYLSAGSPIIVANLWEVTDKDIDRFGKTMLEGWLTERSNCNEGCDQCSEISEDLKSMDIKGGWRNRNKRDMHNKCCRHRPRIGSFMEEARKACILRYLNGASPVCYGVPTGITRKRDQL
ncbi:unnamed protein product [Cuscuta epithymum]|uniref:separase n=1 Tax=Cuscuta epithymum TaxID=186058 RepID=A0AAV0FVD2_9ASTE|nr:unnamed protein product [Cuscuta epithymum]